MTKRESAMLYQTSLLPSSQSDLEVQVICSSEKLAEGMRIALSSRRNMEYIFNQQIFCFLFQWILYVANLKIII